jgi:DNA-binding transcriptional LysR family regulator
MRHLILVTLFIAAAAQTQSGLQLTSLAAAFMIMMIILGLAIIVKPRYFVGALAANMRFWSRLQIWKRAPTSHGDDYYLPWTRMLGVCLIGGGVLGLLSSLY